MHHRPAFKLFLSDADNPFEQMQAAQATAMAQRVGARLDVLFAGGDFLVQVRQIYEATHKADDRPDVVLVMPAKESALNTLAERTVAEGIGWIYLNRFAGTVEPLRQLRPDVISSFVAPDQKEIGRIHARQLRELFPGGGNVLYVHGRATTSSAEARRAGLKETLALPGPKIDIVSGLDGNWNAKEAQAAVTRWLAFMIPANIRVDAVACQNDYMAMGAIEALRLSAEELNNPLLSRIPVLGSDGMASYGQKLVDEERLAATIVMPTTTDKAIELATDAFRNGAEMPAQVLLMSRAYPDDATLVRRYRRTA